MAIRRVHVLYISPAILVLTLLAMSNRSPGALKESSFTGQPINCIRNGRPAEFMGSTFIEQPVPRRTSKEESNSKYVDYVELWNTQSDLKNFWFLTLSTLNHSIWNHEPVKSDIILANSYTDLTERIDRIYKQQHSNHARESLRLIKTGLRRFWKQIQDQRAKKTTNSIEQINSSYRELRRRLMYLMDSSTTYRERILRDLSTKMEKIIRDLQNPKHCDAARLLICLEPTGAGFGSQVHWILICFIHALEHGRTAVLRFENWNYAKSGWEYIFRPFSKCKYTGMIDTLPELDDENARIVRWGKTQRYENPDVSWTIPTQLAPVLTHNHGHPVVWWFSKFIRYAMRFQPWFEEKINQISPKIGFKSPIVGIHVRRKGKVGTSGEKHEVEEYMFFVEQWFEEQKEMGKTFAANVVYVATDDAKVMKELIDKYPRYTFIRNPVEVTRYNEDGLESIVIDIHFLSHCDYVVCTFSSNICRLVYELKMGLHSDASMMLQSIDFSFRLSTIKRITWEAIADHEAVDDELEFKVGDKLFVYNMIKLPYNDGFLRGRNTRTGKKGNILAYKAREKLSTKYYTILQNTTGEIG